MSGVSYYRLRQVDFDGSYTYSEVRAVTIKDFAEFMVYPNPLREVLHIRGKSLAQGNSIIQISDALGRIVYYKQLDSSSQLNSIDVQEVSGFGPGNYFLSIHTGEDVSNFNLVKVKE